MKQDRNIVEMAMKTLEGCSLESTLYLLSEAEFNCLRVKEGKELIRETFWSDSKIQGYVILVSFSIAPKSKICAGFEVEEVLVEDAGFFD